MLNMFKACCMLLWIMLLCCCSSINAIQPMRVHFKSDQLRSANIDLSSNSECRESSPVFIANPSRTTRKVVFFENLGHEHYFMEDEFVALVIGDLEYQLAAGKIPTVNEIVMNQVLVEGKLNNLQIILNTDQISEGRIVAQASYYRDGAWKVETIVVRNVRTILLSLVEAHGSYSSPEPEIVKLKIQIPALNYARIYTGKAHDGDFYRVMARAAHLAMLQFVHDPVFQKYIKCQQQ